MSKSTDAEPSFQEALSQLEALVTRLEAPDTPLEAVISSFTQGQKLLKVCQKRLHQAELVLEKAGDA